MITQKGSALIFVLWIIAILAILGSEVAFNARVNSHLYQAATEKIKTYPAILSCLQTGIAIAESEASSENKTLNGSTFTFSLKEANYQCEITFHDEAGKYNLNQVTEKQLLEIVESLGITGEQRDTIVDSILDWRDPDDLHRLNGAENDYYESLDPPYKCKNGPFSSVTELALVKGISPEIYEKLAPLFTVYTNTTQININSAPLEVLKSLGLSEEAAKLIIQERQKQPFSDMADLAAYIKSLK
jgi:general secretion pathway protein K